MPNVSRPLVALLLVGCAAQPSSNPTVRSPAPTASAGSSSAAADLAFPPPIVANRPTPDVARDDRRPSASNGAETAPSTTTYNVTTTVNDGTDLGGYGQQTVTQKSGTVSR